MHTEGQLDWHLRMSRTIFRSVFHLYSRRQLAYIRNHLWIEAPSALPIGTLGLTIVSAPIEVQAQFPCFAGLDLAPPFHQETLPLAIKRAPIVRQNLLKYQGYLQDREDEIGHHVGIGQVILSEAFAALYGLMEYNQLQLHANQKWMYSLLRLTRDKLLGTEDDK